MVCCLFGHRDAPANTRPMLERVLEQLITEHQAVTVMVGQQGSFDLMAAGVLRKLSERYPMLKCRKVLAYLPRKKSGEDTFETILPEGIEFVPLRFAISWRNRWMIDHSDIVLIYLVHSRGGTGSAAAYSRRRGKEIINPAQL